MGNKQRNEQLDHVGKLILLAGMASEADTEAASSSPFILTRIRAAIADERRRRSESTNWLSIIFVARRAVPAMALIAILAAIVTFWSARITGPSTPVQSDYEALFNDSNPGVEQTVLTSRNGPTREEVFNIVVDRNYGKSAR